MGEAAPIRMVAPNFRTPRLIGIFSVVFAAELLIVGLCLGGYVSVMPMFGKWVVAAQNKAESQAEAARKNDLQAVEAQEKAAKTEADRIEAAVRRREIELRSKSPLSGLMEINKVSLGDTTFIRFSWLDVLSGMVLNVMMLAAGIGLLSWRPWARRLGVWTAVLKLIRLVLIYGFFIIAIVPPYAQRLGKAAGQMMSATQQTVGAKAAPFMSGDFYVRLYTVMYTGFGLGVILVGAIYPAILLWCLTRPAVRSACSGLLKTPKEPNQPW